MGQEIDDLNFCDVLDSRGTLIFGFDQKATYYMCRGVCALRVLLHKNQKILKWHFSAACRWLLLLLTALL